jgi:amino-acid N-acetyltransferase
MIRSAQIKEMREIQKLLELSARKGELLPRSLGELYEAVRDFKVYVDKKGSIVGLCALHPTWEDLGEIRSLFVKEAFRRQGIARRLVSSCLEEARGIGIQRIFTLTFNPAFFLALGFTPIDKATLPHKIWADCVRCVHFPDCKEKALMYSWEDKII